MFDRRFGILILIHVCLLSSCNSVNKDEKNADEKEKKEETTRKPSDDKNVDKAEGESNNTEDSYDTTQGFPILYPETHMVVRRNLSGAQANATSTSINDSDTLEQEELSKCSKSVDLLFLLDSSESVKYSNWKLIILFVKDICNRFRLNNSKVGIIRYASDAEIALPLTQFNTTLDRNMTIDDIFYKTGGTRTDLALQKADEVFQVEEQRSQVAILVTDGPTNRLEINKHHFVEGKDLVVGPASRLKETGVVLFCIGVEPDSLTPEEIETMKEEMRLIASEPTKHHLFISDGYHELERKVEAISRAACVVNGAWSTWSEYSPCSITCGFGTKVRMRTCSNPSPENNGAECNGQRVEIDECKLDPCTFASLHGKPIPLGNSVPPVSSTASPPVAAITTTTTTTTAAPTKEATVKSNDGPVNISVIHINKVNETLIKPHPEAQIPECRIVEEVKLNDNQYNASSVYSHDTNDEYVKKEYAPSNARLNNQINGGSWCAEHKFSEAGDKNQYLQIELEKPVVVHAVATQGSHLLDNWVTKYMLRYSDDGASWKYYSANPLTGNTDQNTVHHNLLAPPVTARFIQFNPVEWNERNGSMQHDICLRAALFQCKDDMKAERSKIAANGTRREFISHGVVLREQEVTPLSRYSNQRFPLTSYVRKKRLFILHEHQQPNKRIFNKLRKTAKCIIRKLWRKKCRA